MTVVWIVVAVWVVVAAVAALLIGRTVHTADVIEHTDESEAHRQDPPDEAEPPVAGAAGFSSPALLRVVAPG
jgi:hypothetical protein